MARKAGTSRVEKAAGNRAGRKGASAGGRAKASAKKGAKKGAKKAVKKKGIGKKVVKKKVARKKTAKKSTGKKKAVKKAGAKKVAKKKAPKKKAVKKATGKKSVKKKAVTKKVAKKKTAKKKTVAKKSASRKAVGRNGRSAVNASTAAKRSPARAASTQDPIQFPELNRKTPKTYLTAKQLREFKTLLLEKRRAMTGDVEHLAFEAFTSAGSGSQSAMPIHMADVGTDHFEHESNLGLIEHEQGLIRQIDEALQRIQDKTYGICLATHKPIRLARLQAKPWAKYSIEYARAREEGRVQ
ncbi:MAG: TraR/DksA family transcriptional regulator [Planctomycetota bacterium]